jgi:host factor-I protein
MQIMAFRPSSSSPTKGKTPPPEETYQEGAYLKQLGEKQKPVTIKLVHGEMVRGWVEYYDRGMIRLTREGAPNLFIFKHEIMYISEGGPAPRKPRPDSKAVPCNGSGGE